MPGREEVLEHLQSVGDRDFEFFLSDLWSHLGWETRVTPQNGDRGVDVVVTRDSPVGLKLVIQAKRYSPSSKVSGPEIQQYNSLKYQEVDVDAVAVVTTSTFTEQAQMEAEALNVKTLDGPRLAGLVEREHAYDVLEPYADGEVVPRPDPSILTDSVPRGGWAEAELENHLFEGYGLHETVPGMLYRADVGEVLCVAHSSGDSPEWKLNGTVDTVAIDDATTENGAQVYLHLTTEGVHVFARTPEDDEHVFVPYDEVTGVVSDSPLFGANEHLTFELAEGGTVQYTFQSMAAEIRNEISKVLANRVGCSVTL